MIAILLNVIISALQCHRSLQKSQAQWPMHLHLVLVRPPLKRTWSPSRLSLRLLTPQALEIRQKLMTSPYLSCEYIEVNMKKRSTVYNIQLLMHFMWFLLSYLWNKEYILICLCQIHLLRDVKQFENNFHKYRTKWIFLTDSLYY